MTQLQGGILLAVSLKSPISVFCSYTEIKWGTV